MFFLKITTVIFAFILISAFFINLSKYVMQRTDSFLLRALSLFVAVAGGFVGAIVFVWAGFGAAFQEGSFFYNWLVNFWLLISVD
ncbi:MAG: hypothetical protein LAT56_14365 [Wenzhouxiangella sp.]|nr:hypothetical protein [Wenzhouxiangella sp.]